MVLQVVYTISSYVLPSGYYVHAAVGVATLVVTYAFSQGRVTDRERDLHARTILMTGGFSPLGLTMISSLASRGAHIIAISPYPLEHPLPALLIPALRETTKNENIFVEHADLSSPASIRDFCTRFLTGEDQRLDAIIYAHEYRGIGSLFASTPAQEARRESGSLATFLLTTLLLPTLLVAPVERDIRVINVVNPFYAAAIPSFISTLIESMSNPSAPPPVRSIFVSEGYRALRTAVFTRHLQRILNALPNRAPSFDQTSPPGPGNSSGAPSPPTGAASEDEKAMKPSPYPSNIVSVSVCPGLSRSETVRVLFGAEREHDPDGWSTFGYILYFILFPFIWIFMKGSVMAMQSVLHALFLPTPLKQALAHAYAATDPSSQPAEGSKTKSTDEAKTKEDLFTEVLKPGALYRECAVVTPFVPPLPPPPEGLLGKQAEEKKSATKLGEKKSQTGKDGKTEVGEDLIIEDDGELGGESVGRVVWEWYERQLKTWEASEKIAADAKPTKAAEESTATS